jgi:enterobactin synthetase component D
MQVISMLHEVESPGVVCSMTAHYSMSFDPAHFGVKTAAHFGVPLPVELHAASQKRQAEFVAGRFCAVKAMQRLGWTEAVVLPAGPNRAPLWPAGMVGSITHTAKFVSAAVASTRDLRSVGIDSEAVMNYRLMCDVSSTIMCGDEWVVRSCESGIGREVFTTLVFSAKESIFKCLFSAVNTIFDFTDVEIFHIDKRSGDFRYRLRKDLSLDFCSGYTGSGKFELRPGYVHTGVELRW